MECETIDIVDKDGKIIGSSTRDEAYERGLLHPAVNIIVFNLRGEVYIQQRSAEKNAFPLYWDISAAEHVKKGESFKSAAIRGLLEELSIRSREVKLIRSKHVQKSEYKRGDLLVKEYELVELYGVVHNGGIEIDPDEVTQGKFVKLDELRNFDESNFTPWGLDEIQHILTSTSVWRKLFD